MKPASTATLVTLATAGGMLLAAGVLVGVVVGAAVVIVKFPWAFVVFLVGGVLASIWLPAYAAAKQDAQMAARSAAVRRQFSKGRTET